MHSSIVGTGRFLPHSPVTNAELPGSLGTSDEWIYTRTGIRARHQARGMSTLEMAHHAAVNALESAGIGADELDLIIAATISGDMVFPSLSALLQNALCARTIGALDVSAACSGFLYGLALSDAMICSGRARNILIVGSEKMSRLLDPNDRSTAVLFGDGAGAAVVSTSTSPGICAVQMFSDGGAAPSLRCAPALGRPYIEMNGQAVFRSAVRAMSQAASDILARHGLGAADVSWFVPHQANIRIVEAVATEVGIPMERVVVTLREHANVSAASIPIALDVAVRDGRIKRNDLLLMTAVGGGLTWAAALVRW